ncbi:MAG: hypothetical protein R3B82_24685 [Sandaracinaceae bacterium]
MRYDVFAYWHTHPGEQADGHDEIVEHFGDNYHDLGEGRAVPGRRVRQGRQQDSRRLGVAARRRHALGASWVVRGGGTLADHVGFPESPFVALCTPR